MYDTPTHNNHSSTSNSSDNTSSTHKSFALKLPVLEEDRFQLSVGKLLLSLQKKDRSTFDNVMDKARAQVRILPCSAYDMYRWSVATSVHSDDYMCLYNI